MVSEIHNRRFGETLRAIREQRNYGLRELARAVGMTPAYLSMIENGKEPPPSQEMVTAIARCLALDANELSTLAGRLPEDLVEILRERPLRMTALLRMSHLLRDKELDGLIDSIPRRLEGGPPVSEGREWERAKRRAREAYEAFRDRRQRSEYDVLPRRNPPWRG